jgi:hypothetical protein
MMSGHIDDPRNRLINEHPLSNQLFRRTTIDSQERFLYEGMIVRGNGLGSSNQFDGLASVIFSLLPLLFDGNR